MKESLEKFKNTLDLKKFVENQFWLQKHVNKRVEKIIESDKVSLGSIRKVDFDPPFFTPDYAVVEWRAVSNTDSGSMKIPLELIWSNNFEDKLDSVEVM